jgi:hypothetical protein
MRLGIAELSLEEISLHFFSTPREKTFLTA